MSLYRLQSFSNICHDLLTASKTAISKYNNIPNEVLDVLTVQSIGAILENFVGNSLIDNNEWSRPENNNGKSDFYYKKISIDMKCSSMSGATFSFNKSLKTSDMFLLFKIKLNRQRRIEKISVGILDVKGAKKSMNLYYKNVSKCPTHVNIAPFSVYKDECKHYYSLIGNTVTYKKRTKYLQFNQIYADQLTY